MFVNSDFTDLLKSLNDNHVEYLVVGGYAVIQYAEPRFTKDLDIWIAVNPDNSVRIFSALKEFGAPLAGMTEKDFMEEGYFYQMGNPPMRVDILMGIPGVAFSEAWERRNVFNFESLTVPFISKADLVTAKRASGRPQDIIDADLLEGEA